MQWAYQCYQIGRFLQYKTRVRYYVLFTEPTIIYSRDGYSTEFFLALLECTGCPRSSYPINIVSHYLCKMDHYFLNILICPRSSGPFLFCKLLNKMGHYFMDTQYNHTTVFMRWIADVTLHVLTYFWVTIFGDRGQSFTNFCWFNLVHVYCLVMIWKQKRVFKKIKFPLNNLQWAEKIVEISTEKIHSI